MKVNCYNSQDSLKIPPARVQLLVECMLAFKKVKTDELSIHFVDKKTISELHQEFFQDPTPTDCITFPVDAPDEDPGGHHVLGEVFVCPEVAIEYAKDHKLLPYDEVSMYIIHGLLHLLGYDDLSLDEEKIMREEEKRCMKYLREQNALIDEASES
ncbi:rRNA maturation RNase YbeY [Simkania sp.]|uniref:rRNA maturation RNase YbeY n=1 Tax=Simkania sp. TaxID=34094 RepID=UPI003B52D8FF